jgi:hypothetical protein
MGDRRLRLHGTDAPWVQARFLISRYEPRQAEAYEEGPDQESWSRQLTDVPRINAATLHQVPPAQPARRTQAHR